MYRVSGFNPVACEGLDLLGGYGTVCGSEVCDVCSVLLPVGLAPSGQRLRMAALGCRLVGSSVLARAAALGRFGLWGGAHCTGGVVVAFRGAGGAVGVFRWQSGVFSACFGVQSPVIDSVSACGVSHPASGQLVRRRGFCFAVVVLVGADMVEEADAECFVWGGELGAEAVVVFYDFVSEGTAAGGVPVAVVGVRGVLEHCCL